MRFCMIRIHKTYKQNSPKVPHHRSTISEMYSIFRKCRKMSSTNSKWVSFGWNIFVSDTSQG